MSSAENLKYDFVHKIVVLGDGAVGKTSLIKRYTQGSFNKEYIKTLGAQFSRYEKIMGKNNEIRERLLFWDIAGQREFSFMRATFYNGAKAVILVYDLTREETLDSVEDWYEDVTKYCGKLPAVLFGNKVDLIGDPSNYNKDKAQKIVDKYGFLGFYLTSAKTGEHVTEAFDAIINVLVEQSLKQKELTHEK